MEKDKNKMENKKLTELLEHLEYELSWKNRRRRQTEQESTATEQSRIHCRSADGTEVPFQEKYVLCTEPPHIEIEENKVCQGYFRMQIHRNRS